MIKKPDYAEKVLFLYKLIKEAYQADRRLGIEDIKEAFRTSGDISVDDISDRTINRYLKFLKELELIDVGREGRFTEYIPTRKKHITYDLNFSSNELLSFYLLKAHLKTFKGTDIDETIKELMRKLEKIAPGSPFSSDSLFWDQNVGQYDYTMHNDILRRVISYINDKEYTMVTYQSSPIKDPKTYLVLFEKIFTYKGALYVAYYTPKYKKHRSLKLECILEMSPAENAPEEIPEFKFDKFTKDRFGVFDGEKQHCELEIRNGFEHYFRNRSFHPSQKMEQDNGKTVIKMHCPVAPDLISWVMSWGDILTVRKPEKLISEIKIKANNILSNYSK